MKRIILTYFTLLILIFANNALSQRVSGRLSTSLYSWERFNSAGGSEVITRLYQNILIDGGDGNFSFHTSVAGAMGGSSSFSSDAQIRVSRGYLSWKDAGGTLDLNIGRVPVFAGVGNGIVDGLSFKMNRRNGTIFFTGYGGLNVGPALRSNALDKIDQNFFFGGQLIGQLFKGSRIGLSYMNRSRHVESYAAIRPDSMFNPADVVIQPEANKEQIAGLDINYRSDGIISAYGRIDYGTNKNNLIRGEMSVRVGVTRRLSFDGNYIYLEPRIPVHSFFRVFGIEPINELGGGVEYSFSPQLVLFGRTAFVRYDDEISRRLTIGLNSRYGSVRYSGSSGYSGQLASFGAECMYPLFRRKFTPTLGFSFSSYRLDEKSDSREDLYAGALGFTVRPVPALSFDAQAQWLRNKIARNDFRVFCRISYWFSHNIPPTRPGKRGE